MDGQTRDVEANGVRLAYETFGRPDDPPLLLIMGLGTQMIAWPDPMCAELAASGLFVIRYDNRDMGLSAHLSDLPRPTLIRSLARRTPYTIDDLADDAAGLLEALGLDSAHVVGASMGGFIAQSLAIRHPGRVRSLTLMMTSTGSPLVGQPRLRVIVRALRQRPATTREAAIEAAVATFRTIGSPQDADEPYLRDLAAQSYERAYDPAGTQRQLAAILAQPNRTRALRRLTVPAVVIHGLADPLVRPSGGRALARAIPQARFVGVPGMGHDLPPKRWPLFVAEIRAVVARGERARAGRSAAEAGR